MNVIEAKEVLVTHTHLALSLEYAAGGSLTSYVADRWQHSQHSGLFLSEDEARYFFRVSMQHSKGATPSYQSRCLFALLTWKLSVLVEFIRIFVCKLQQFIGAVEYCHQHLVAHRYGLQMLRSSFTHFAPCFQAIAWSHQAHLLQMLHNLSPQFVTTQSWLALLLVSQ